MSDRDEKPPREGEPLPPKIVELPDIETRLNRVINLAAQFFPDFLIAVRFDKERPIAWKASDRTWAIGACKRYIVTAEENDRIQQHEDEQQPPPAPPDNEEEQTS
jgi:hypothetical protein